jgi:uncharacterized damage-inducible protein DinB
MSTMHELLNVLLANLDEAYEKRGWHGTNLRGALRGVTPAQAQARPGRGRHNVYELTLHAAYWKYAVRRRLTGEKRGSFPLKGSNWYATPAKLDEAGWREAVHLLNEQHRLLRDVIAALSDADLRDPKKLRMIYGVAAHDAYHTGQIQMVKRLTS